MFMGRVLGSILLISGTAIGAGMLALPATTADAGFVPTSIIFVVIWAMTLASSLLLLEVNLNLPSAKDMLSMAEVSLGRTGKIATWLSFLCLLYALTAAYITGGAQWMGSALSTLHLETHANPISQLIAHSQAEFSAVLFTFILGLIIYLGTHAVDGVNRFFMLLLGVSFVVIESIGLRAHTVHAHSISNFSAVWAAVPVILTSFGFHPVIPTLTEYLKRDKRLLKRAIVIGSTIPLFIYILWIGTVFNWLPTEALQTMSHAEDKLHVFIELTTEYSSSPYLSVFLKAFSLAVLLTSFLGVAMSLFHFLEDGLHHKVSHPIVVSFITFIPPLFFALKFPEGFVFALGFGGIFVAFLLGILPCLMAWRVRDTLKEKSVVFVPGGKSVLLLLILLFLTVIVLEVYYAHLIPHLT